MSSTAPGRRAQKRRVAQQVHAVGAEARVDARAQEGRCRSSIRAPSPPRRRRALTARRRASPARRAALPSRRSSTAAPSAPRAKLLPQSGRRFARALSSASRACTRISRPYSARPCSISASPSRTPRRSQAARAVRRRSSALRASLCAPERGSVQETHFSFPAKPSPVLTHSSQSEPNCSVMAMSPRRRRRQQPLAHAVQPAAPDAAAAGRPAAGRPASARAGISPPAAPRWKSALGKQAERCRAITSGSGAGTLTSTSRRTPQHESAPHSSSRQAASSRRTPPVAQVVVSLQRGCGGGHAPRVEFKIVRQAREPLCRHGAAAQHVQEAPAGPYERVRHSLFPPYSAKAGPPAPPFLRLLFCPVRLPTSCARAGRRPARRWTAAC